MRPWAGWNSFSTLSPNRYLLGWAEPKHYSVGYGQKSQPTQKTTYIRLCVRRLAIALETARRLGGRARLATTHPEGFPPPPSTYRGELRSPEMERVPYRYPLNYELLLVLFL